MTTQIKDVLKELSLTFDSLSEGLKKKLNELKVYEDTKEKLNELLSDADITEEKKEEFTSDLAEVENDIKEESKKIVARIRDWHSKRDYYRERGKNLKSGKTKKEAVQTEKPTEQPPDAKQSNVIAPIVPLKDDTVNVDGEKKKISWIWWVAGFSAAALGFGFLIKNIKNE
ncbi:MAG: hypothetical protein ACRDE2_00150 [Chitinophagaceae bacterium]